MGYIGNEPTTGHFPVQTNLAGNGVTRTFTMDRAPATIGSIEVSVQGIIQPTTAYTISGTTLTLPAAGTVIANGVPIFIRYLGETLLIPTPADDSVDGAQLSPALVAGDIIYSDGTDSIERLAKGTAAQVLTMNAGATAPEWAAAAGGGVDGITSSANTTAMTISADEEINMPLQPVFAHTTANTSDNQDVTGDGTLYTILFNTQKFDIGSNTNANGVFTAPITGVYLFGYHLEIVDGTHNKDYDYIYLDTGGFDPGSQHHFSSVSIDLHERVQMTFLVQMTAGWTAIPRIARHSGTKDSDIRGGSSHFWGVLIA